MTCRIIPAFLFAIALFACGDTTSKTIKKERKSIVPSKIKDKTNLVSDTVRQIIDELDLCQYAEMFNENTPNLFDCYDKDVSDIRLIKKGDTNYDNFIFQSPGGSGGGTIIIYSKKNGKYEIVQDDYGCLIEVLTTSTKGYFDLVIWHREQKAGGEDVLYQWNGKKYIKIKVLKNYSKE